jgi:serine/threonine-protein kinase HipA
MNGELVGHWRVASTGQHRLEYASRWLASARCRPISLSLPLLPEGQAHPGAVVENFFENLLPDSSALRHEPAMPWPCWRRWGCRPD